MGNEFNLETRTLPKSFEKMILSELGVESLEEVSSAMEEGRWPFKIQAMDLWKKISDYFEQPLTTEDVVALLIGVKTEEEIKQSLEKKQWPFTVSADQMREQNNNLEK